ncbi:MAG: hypothetical protein K0R17_564 [Rariglobus sp.]|jgi:hypothetical protein|nr:hypothetical protein [Rariglobus sp.]
MSVPLPHFAVLAFLLVANAASGAVVSLQGLVTNSPFVLKQEETAAPAVTEGATVEFRGVITTKEGVLFGFYDRAKNLGAWVTQRDTGSDFKVSAYDAGSDLVTVDYQGQRFTLPLSSPKITAAAPAPLPVVNNAQPGGNRVTAVPAARDQQRLESVAAEVRRRRALRQSAATGTTPAAQPAASGQ